MTPFTSVSSTLPGHEALALTHRHVSVLLPAGRALTLRGVALAAMPTVWLTAVTGRFNVSRGLAVAVALSGTGLSNFIVPVHIGTIYG